MGSGPGRADELTTLSESLVARLDAVNAAREAGLAACRRTVRASGSAVRAVHRLQPDEAARWRDEARKALRQAQQVLAPYPAVAYAGFLHDASKEYAEACFTAALVAGEPIPPPEDLGVEVPAWLCGLAEAASELRRHVLDRLREGKLDQGETLLRAMEDVYELLVTIDYPDAMTGGLRRIVDTLRAVLERTRGDITTTALQSRLQTAIEGSLPADGPA